MKQHKLKVLLFTDWYTPGYKAGGPIQSCQNIVSYFKEEYSFYILTSDTDLGATKAYETVQSNVWVQGISGENVFYGAKNYLNLSRVKQIIKEVKPDIIYFNSMFSWKFTITPLIALKLVADKCQVVLAPRGMLHLGALSIKSSKKIKFLKIFKLLGWHKSIRFHATDAQEMADIAHYFPESNIVFAKNVPNLQIAKKVLYQKQSGTVRLIFLSRLHPKKNLAYFLSILQTEKMAGKIILDIYGATESANYLLECKQLVHSLQLNIEVQFYDSIPNKMVAGKLKEYDALVLPTLGENFGHVIFEALMGGVPVLISDQTPWRGLSERRAGWDISLKSPQLFKLAVDQLIAMDTEEYSLWSQGARNMAECYLNTAAFNSDYQKLFNV